MNRLLRLSILSKYILAFILLAGCVSQPSASPVALQPTSETITEEALVVPSDTPVEATIIPSATQPLSSPTRTPFPTASPVPTIAFPELTGDYLGQDLPGLEPVLFAPGIISTGMNERDLTISPIGDEIFYALPGRLFSTILWVKRVEGVWQEPQIAPFSGVNSDQDPEFSPDGEKLFFVSKRPPEGTGPDEEGFKIFFVEREGDGWGIPQSAGMAVNQGENQFAPSVATDGTLYFHARYPGGEGDWDLYRSQLVEGEYQAPENLGVLLNSDSFEHNPCIAPDQEYLLFTRYTMLYISYQDGDGYWQKPKNLMTDFGIDDLPTYIWSANVSPDRKVVFISGTIGRPTELASTPPGYNNIADAIGDTFKIENLHILPIVKFSNAVSYVNPLDIYWVSGEVLFGLDD